MADNAIEMREGGQSSGRAGGFQTTPGRAPGESSADMEREEGPYSASRSGPADSPMQNPMYIGGAVGAVVLLLLLIGLMMKSGGEESTTGPTPAPPGPPVGPPVDTEQYRPVVDGACDKQKQIYKSPPELAHLEHFLAEFGSLCDSKGHKDAVIEVPPSDIKSFLLKAKGPMKHDLYFKPLTAVQKDSYLNFWKDKDVKERSYMIPLVAIVEADGQAWGLQPSPFLDGKKGKTYPITGEGHGEWEFRFDAGPLKMTMEHWEKMTIRLSEDVSSLLKFSNSQYNMQVSVFDEDVTDKNSLGKHTWTVKDGKGGSHSLLFGGITDYLAATPDEASEKETASRACRFFLQITTQMVKPCKCAHDHDHGDDHGPGDECIDHFDVLFKDILKGTLPDKDTDKLDKVCEAITVGGVDASKVMGFEAQLLQHAIEQLEADIPCEGHFRAPENCKKKFEYEGVMKEGCVTDAYLFEDIKAPWCSWKDKMESGADWDGPWSFCVRCIEKPDDDDTGGGDEPGPGPDVDEDDGDTAVKALCDLPEEEDITDLAEQNPSMKETMNQIRALCAQTDNKPEVTKVAGSSRPHEMLLKAKGPLKIDVNLFALMDSEKEKFQDDGMPKEPTQKEWSLLVPVIAGFREGNLVWAVTPATQLDATAESLVGGLVKSYKIGGTTEHEANLPHWEGFKKDYPNGLGISMEHWAKLIVRLVEDMQILKEMGSISYRLEVGIHNKMPDEDTTVKNALGKHVLRAYDFATKKEVGMLPGGVVDYLQEESKSNLGVSSAVYACEFLLFATTKMFVPCRWPMNDEAPEEAKCVTDFTELWPNILGKDGTELKGDDDEYLAQVCQSLNDQTNLLADVGKILEFVDVKANGEKPCLDGFRQPEHCLGEFKYDGENIDSGCAKQELFPEIKAPWCSWKAKLDKGPEWDGPWSFCTLCSGEDESNRRIVV
jgi:hypothetical protein